MAGQEPVSVRPRPANRGLFQRKNLPWIIAILVVHLAVLTVSLVRHSYLIDDSIQYLTLSENFLEHGAFSQSYQPPLVPDVQRTPGYPVLLGLTWNTPFLVLILQHLLLLLSGFVLYKLVREYVGRRVSRIVAFLYLLQPYPILFASMILSETLFVTLLLTGLLYVVRHWRTGGRTQLGVGLGMLCLAAYVRPVGLPIVALLIIVLGIRLLMNRKGALVRAVMLVGIPVLLLAPWMVRNYLVADAFTFNTMGDMGMIHGRLGGLEAHRRGVDFHEHRLYMAGDSIVSMEIGLGNLRHYYTTKANHETELYHPKVSAITFSYYAKHPVEAIVFQGRAVGQMLTGVGYGWAGKVLGNEHWAMGAAGVQLIFNLLMYLGVLVAVVRIRKGNALVWVSLIVIGGVLIVSAAAWADGRYRMVVDPLMMGLVAVGISGWRQKTAK